VITADQLLAHAIGDYILQSDWMATEKTKKSIAALAHAATYGLPFLFFRPSWKAYAVIAGTHFVIDRWRLARFVVWIKNFLGPRQACLLPSDGVSAKSYRDYAMIGRIRHNYPWSECRGTGYPPTTPAWLAVWLLIIADNIMHVVINGLALKYL